MAGGGAVVDQPEAYEAGLNLVCRIGPT